MSRPKNNRIVYQPPLFSEFKPIGVNAKDLDQIQLMLDEYEAIRLADKEGFSHEEAAEEMGISRTTFTRLIENARKKMADFIIQGRLLSIEGGSVHFRRNIIQCSSCGHMFKINIDKSIDECPVCHSTSIINHAGGFGHGKCCGYHHKKGGENASW